MIFINLLIDMLNKINEFYKDAKKSCQHLKNENNLAQLDFDQNEDNLEYIGEVENHIHDQIQAISFTNRNEYENLLSLLIIHYYTLIAGDGEYYEDLENAEDENEYEELYDELIEMIVDLDKDTLISSIENQENTYLYDLLDLVIEEELQYHEEDDDKTIEDYDDISYMEETLKREEGIKIYRKFHPNLELELEHFQYQQKKEEIFNKLKEIRIKNINDFFYAFNLVKNSLKTIHYINPVLRNILYEIEDKKILNTIMAALLSYYYVYQKNYNEYFDEDFFINVELKYAFDDTRDFISAYDYVIKCFCNFDMSEYYKLLNNLSENDKIKLNLIKKN